MTLDITTQKDKCDKNTSNLCRLKSKHKLNININKALPVHLLLPLLLLLGSGYNTRDVIAMSSYPQYQYFPSPVAYTEWSSLTPLNPLHTMPMPIPVLVNQTPVFSSSICPYVPSVVTPPIVTHIASNYSTPYFEPMSDTESSFGSFYGNDNMKNSLENEDAMVHYLSLPKDQFPSARMLKINPNSLIEEFCVLPNLYRHVAWILDLEFGIPKSPITRPIPCYNVKFNSINCKNTPDAIHPGFESCNQDFKNVLLFYYDSVISVWYTSYVFLTNDTSVDNFQAWLMLPMQELGMCWS